MAEKSVLLLEANEHNLLRFERVLQGAGYKIYRALNFRDAFEMLKLKGRSLSVLLLDFELATDDPEMMERVRRLDFEKDLPVVIMGEVKLTLPEVKQLCLDSGYAGYLNKKSSDKDMLKVLAGLMPSSRIERKHPRVFMQKSVNCQFPGRNFVTETFNVSIGGMFLRLDHDLPPIGSKGMISMVLDGSAKVALKCDVEVTYVHEGQADVVSIFPPGIGIRFLNLDALAEKYLKLLIVELMEKNNKESAQG